MQLARPAFASDPRRFGRGPARVLDDVPRPRAPARRRPQAVRRDLRRRLPVRLDPDRLSGSVAGEVELPAEPGRDEAHRRDQQQLAAGPTPTLLSPNASSEPITIAPELTILFAATVRAVSVFGTVVVRKA